MLLKLLGLGIKGYVIDKFNVFDAGIVIIGFFDIIVQYTGQKSGGGSVTSAFRAFRLFRAFKIAKSWSQLQNILKTIANTIKDISNFSILLFLFIFIYSLLGMELFAYKVRFNEDNIFENSEDGEFPASTFNSFVEAFYSVFIVLANDGWTTIYLNHYRATDGFRASSFFLSLLVIG